MCECYYSDHAHADVTKVLTDSVHQTPELEGFLLWLWLPYGQVRVQVR